MARRIKSRLSALFTSVMSSSICIFVVALMKKREEKQIEKLKCVIPVFHD